MFKEIHLEFHDRIIPFDEYRDNPEPIVFYFSGKTPVELNLLTLSFSDSCQKIIYYFEEGSKYPKIIPVDGDVPAGVKSVIYCHKGGFDIFSISRDHL